MKQFIVVAAAMAALTLGPVHAAEPAAGHSHSAQTTELQLNAGKKWETDAPLRKHMGEIRQAMAAALPAVHDNRLPAAEYGALAKKVEGSVANIVAQCKLPPDADAQLHIIVAQMLAGTDQMAGKSQSGEPRGGAVKVVNALDNYGGYFNDPGFEPLKR
ncbi:MAG: hypothetical protein EPN41_05150 [Candidimonas sp.]|nr:MAG: hypothetical protein EPN41_05150 [Candidimonas sp.]